MSTTDPPRGPALGYESPPARKPLVPDDIAYLAPMFLFLALTWLGGNWRTDHPWTYPASYLAKTILTAAALVILRPSFTKIRWNHWYLGILIGVIGTFQWIPMQLVLQKYIPFFKPSPDFFDPTKFFQTPISFWSFVALRIVGAVLVVPFMEELFWRDYLWRQIIAPNDFKLAQVGEWDPKAFFGVSIAFAFVHGNWWLTAIVWAMLVGALLIYTKSLGACIIAHATTNLLLALYVLHWKDWAFW